MRTISSNEFDWKKNRGTGSAHELGITPFPDSFYVKSAKTGKSLLFLPDAEEMERNEFFDGEGQAYFSPGGDVTVMLWM